MTTSDHASRLPTVASLLILFLATNYSTSALESGRALSQKTSALGAHKIANNSLAKIAERETEPTTSESSTTTSERGSSTAPNTGRRCNAASEFHCQIEDRCVPLEWRCDFTEQCLSGLDELGCATDWCDFGRDSCYWINKLDNGTRSDLPARNKSGPNHFERHDKSAPASLTRSGFWRRFLPEARRDKQNSQVGHLLDSLSLKSASRAKFIFVPLQLEQADLDALERQPGGNNKLVKRARIATPQIGRTNSQCQLRFEFAFWPAAPSSPQASLSLVARSAETNSSRVLWRRNGDEHEASRALADSTDWTVGVAELGHLSRAELSFEAELIANLPTGWPRSANDPSGARRLEQPPAGRSGTAAQAAAPSNETAERVAFEGAIVALRWIQFHDCRWPQGEPIMDSLADDDGSPNSGQASLAGLALEQETCSSADEFKCSTGICVPRRRLCNFVDDCMSAAGLEDEAESLCGPLADSSESFESPSMGANNMQLFTANRAHKFWHLHGNWSLDRASVRNNLPGLRHLPRLDHTSHNNSGRFLSLELAQSAESSAKGHKLAWAAINSRWMEKTGAESECRLKFFYNLVASQPRHLYANSSRPPFKLSLVVEHHKLQVCEADLLGEECSAWQVPTRQVDAFIHSHTLQQSAFQPEAVEYPGVDFWREANVRLAYLQPGDLFYIRLLVFVEFTGEWAGEPRASINLDDLNTDLGCGSAMETSAASGLSQERKFDNELMSMLKANKPPQLSSKLPYCPMRDRLRRYHYGWLDGSDEANSDKLTTRNQLNSHQVEAQELIAYVSGAFLVMIGVIAIIVFVLVPHVERAMMNYQDQIQLSLSGEISDSPISQATIYDLAGGSSRRQRRARTWSFDSLTTTTGFSSALAVAKKPSGQFSVSCSTDPTEDGYLVADTNLDDSLSSPSTAFKNLNSQEQHNGKQDRSEMTLEELDEELNSSAFFCVQDSNGFQVSINDSSSTSNSSLSS